MNHLRNVVRLLQGLSPGLTLSFLFEGFVILNKLIKHTAFFVPELA